MDAELRKRIEQSFIKWLNENRDKTTIACYADETLAHFCYKAGAEHGYKEAIAQAENWLKEHTVTRMPDEDDEDFVWVEGDMYEEKSGFIARFEEYMNKLWEDEK